MSAPVLLRKRKYNVRKQLFAQNEQGLWLDPSDMTAGKADWRRNLLGYTEQFDNAYWIKSGATIAANSTTAPDGTLTADELTTSLSSQGVYKTLTTYTPSGTYTASIYAKASGTNTLRFGLTNQDESDKSYYTFTLTGSGSVVLQDNTDFTNNAASIESIGNGWYRCIVTGTLATVGPTAVGVFIRTGQNGGTAHIWGVQLEERSTASGYQPITDFSTEFKAAFPAHTLYQDSNGVTPCTAAGDPVGLILDQSRGGLGNLGPELITDPTLTSTTGWVFDAGWSASSGTIIGDNAAAGAQIFANSPEILTQGRWYVVEVEITAQTGNSIRIDCRPFSGGTGATNHASLSGVATHRTIVNNTGANTRICFRLPSSAAPGTVTITRVSVKEIPGNHAYQSTSGARTTLGRVPFGGRRNLLTRSEEFDNAAWVKIASSIAANADTAPDGTTTADLLTEDSTSNVHHTNQSFTTTVQTYTFSVYLKNPTSNGRRYALLYHNESVKGWTFDLLNGVVGAGGTTGVGAPAAYGITSVGNGWYRCYITVTGTAASNNFRVYLVNNDGSGGAAYLGNGTSRLLIWGAQLETGSTATTYQRVTSTHDVTEAGQPDCWYLDTSGSKWMQTNAIDFNTWTQETRRNLLFEGDQFDATGWTKTNATITANAVANPVNGAIDADLMIESVATGAHNVTRADFNCVAGQAYTCSCYVKAAGRTVFQMVITSGVVASGFANFDLQNGVVGSKAAGVTSTYMVDLGNGWYRCVAEFTSASTTSGIINFATVTTPTSARAESYTGDGTSGVYMYGGQWEAGTLTDYQRVGTDEMTVIAGVRKLSDSLRGMVVESSVEWQSNNGTFAIEAPEGSPGTGYRFVSRGTTSDSQTSTGITAPATRVLSLIADISSPSLIGRANSVAITTSTATQGTGNYGNHVLYIAVRGAGSSLFLNGHLFHLIIRGRSTTGSKLTGAERLTARKTGITI